MRIGQRKARAHLGTAAATVGIAATMLVGSATAEAAQAYPAVYGCPYGAVCIYAEGQGLDAANITNIYWSYGPHNLRNQFNSHWLINNQYGGATATLCYGYNGTNCTGRIMYPHEQGSGIYREDLTPINSITLNRP